MMVTPPTYSRLVRGLSFFLLLSTASWMACPTSTPNPEESVSDGAATSELIAEPTPDTAAARETAPEPVPEPVKEPIDPNGKLPLPAEPMPPKRYSGKTCPTLKAGENAITSEFLERAFQLYLPANPKGAPLLFVWHPLGGNAQQIATAFGAAALSQLYGAVVVVPHSCCSGPVKLDCCSQATEWSFVGDTEPDKVFFDDMLSCVDQQFDIDNKRVMTTGFSAGSLWSSFLVVHRSEYLAAAVIFSGGVGIFDYSTPRYPVPVILAWGGIRDKLGGLIDFDRMTQSFEEKLKEDKHFVVSCNHGAGHTIPQSAGTWAFPFLFAHTFGDGTTTYNQPDKQKVFPSYCKFP